jgi:tetratricopeptide (TPR) repeat protein
MNAGDHSAPRRNLLFLRSAFCILTSAFLPGCIPEQQQPPVSQKPPASLVAADQALTANLPDQAIADAQSYLRGNPQGSAAAQAWYFEGRGYEQKLAADPAQVQQDLFQANSCYQQALNQNPSSPLEGDIRASLSNVLFFQDKFADAIYQATNAMPLVSSQSVKSFLQLRIGECQQRLGRFNDADQTFNKVQQMYPGSPEAQAAHDHEGIHEFYVQLASYADEKQAELAAASLMGSGEVVSRRTNSKGTTIIDLGAYNTYAAAKAVKDRLARNFPLAEIVP